MSKPFTQPGNLCIRYCMVKVFAGYVCNKIYLCFSMGTSVIQWSIYEYNNILFSLIDGTVTNLTPIFSSIWFISRCEIKSITLFLTAGTCTMNIKNQAN